MNNTQILSGLTDDEVVALATGQNITVNIYDLKRISRLNKGLETEITSDNFKNDYALPLTGYELIDYVYVGQEKDELILKSDSNTCRIRMTDYEAMPLNAEVRIGNREYDFDTMTVEAISMISALLEDVKFEGKDISNMNICMSAYFPKRKKDR